jgi:Tol biopolymer transport system component
MKILAIITFIALSLGNYGDVDNINYNTNDLDSDFAIKDYGQKNPGIVPELFAPDYIRSEHRIHSSPSFSPIKNEVYWSVFPRSSDIKHKDETILFSQKLENRWSSPKVATFSGKYADGGPFFSSDGRKLYFYSKRPINTKTNVETKSEIWYVEKLGDNWTKPKHIKLDCDGEKIFFSLSNNNNIYFTSGHGYRGVGAGSVDIYSARFINGSYAKPEKLPNDINSKQFVESDPLISPDENYIIFFSLERPGNIGQYDLFISYSLKNNQWTKPINLGEDINKGYSRFPRFSPDGKYIFFVRQDGVYWVDSSIIHNIKK